MINNNSSNLDKPKFNGLMDTTKEFEEAMRERKNKTPKYNPNDVLEAMKRMIATNDKSYLIMRGSDTLMRMLDEEIRKKE